MPQDLPTPGRRPRNGTLISLVDDDELFRTSTSRLLRVLGFKVKSFSSAADFLVSPYLHETACLIVDVQMPPISGPELHNQIIGMGLQIPLIFVTAHAAESIRTMPMARRAVEVLQKPFSEEALVLAVRTALISDIS